MLGFFSKKKKYNWKKEQTRLWNELVPASGSAETLQGELVRLVGKLTDQAYRNGNMNWNDLYPLSWRFIGEKICVDGTFSVDEKKLIQTKIEEIIRDESCPDLSGDGSTYYVISEKVVDWCIAHPAPIPHDEVRDLIT